MTGPATLAEFSDDLSRAAPRPPAPPQARLAAGLLGHLRRALGEPRASYADPPQALRGGSNCFIYRFRLVGAPGGLDGPLVLRLYPRGRGEHRVGKEAAFQNALAAQGYPAPRVHLHEADPGILGGAFLVARFHPGAHMAASPAAAAPLADAHAALHAADTGPVAAALRGLGWEERRYRLAAADEAAALARWPGLADRFRPLVDWLAANRPPPARPPAVCHGDFHPFNVLVEGGRVTAVLDWSNVVLADPELDVARTAAFAALAARRLPSVRDPAALAARYLERYRSRRALDADLLGYYRVRHSALALINVAGSWAIWQDPALVRELEDGVRRATGIALAPAPGA